MYLIAHAEKCEFSGTLVTRWSTKCNNQSSMIENTPPSKGGWEDVTESSAHIQTGTTHA